MTNFTSDAIEMWWMVVWSRFWRSAIWLVISRSTRKCSSARIYTVRYIATVLYCTVHCYCFILYGTLLLFRSSHMSSLLMGTSVKLPLLPFENKFAAVAVTADWCRWNIMTLNDSATSKIRWMAFLFFIWKKYETDFPSKKQFWDL